MIYKFIKNITTHIEGADVGTLIIKWDMKYWFDYPDDLPNGRESNLKVEHRDVLNILSVELQLSDKVGVDIFPAIQSLPAASFMQAMGIIKAELLSITMDCPIGELENEIV